MSKLIPLTQGYSAIVDDDDFEFLSQWKWHAHPGCSAHVYAARNSQPVNGKRHHIFMHRMLAETPSNMSTDHIDGNGLNNQRANLRNVTKTQNMWNRAANSGGSSPRKGVHWHSQHRKWAASIQVDKKRRHLGLFASEADAADAYQRAAVEAFGQFNRSL